MYPLCSYRKYYKKIADKNNDLICISKEVMKEFEGKVNKNMIHQIYNGISEENLNENKIFNKSKKLICIQSGMISKAKGQDITIRAIEILRKKGIKNIELLIAGRGDLVSLGINIQNKPWINVLG